MKSRLLSAILFGVCFRILAFENPPVGAGPPGNPPQVTPNSTKPVALRIVGSNVKNRKGEFLGRIENVAVNPETKQVEFALLDTSYPAKSGLVTPVPWQLLTYVWDQSQIGGLPGAVQLFQLDLDRQRLSHAPKIEKTHVAELGQPQRREQLQAFYGAGSEFAAAAPTEPSTPFESNVPTWPYFPGAFDAGPGLTVQVPFVTNNLNQVTNFVPNTAVLTNVFPGTTNAFAGGTPFPGAPASIPPSATNGIPPGTAQSVNSGQTFHGVNSPQQTQQKPQTPTVSGNRPSPWTPPRTVVIPVPPSMPAAPTPPSQFLPPTLPPAPSPRSAVRH